MCYEGLVGGVAYQSLTFRQSGCFGPSVSNLCPTPFDGIRFLKLFQRSGRAIRAGDILAKLLSKLHLRAFCSHFCELTLNQRFSVLPVPIASFGRRANTGPLRIPSRYFQGLTLPPVLSLQMTFILTFE